MGTREASVQPLRRAIHVARFVCRSCAGALTCLVLLAVARNADALTSLLQPIVEHYGVSGLSSTDFSEIEAVVGSDADVRSAKLYFRSKGNPDFHFVEMKLDAERGAVVGVLPIPEPEAEQVEYFIEVSGDGGGGRSGSAIRPHSYRLF